MSFFNVHNLQGLLQALNAQLASEDIDIRASGVNPKRFLYKIMCDIEGEEATGSLHPRDKNELAMKTALNFYKACAKEEFVVIDDRVDRMRSARERQDASVDVGNPYVEFVQKRMDPDSMSTPISELKQSGCADTIIPRSGAVKLVERYLMINGYDRDWAAFPNRFRIKPDLRSNDATFKNIRRIAATRLIIPREIIEPRSIEAPPRQDYRHDFGLPYPYLIMTVDELQSVYRGSNGASGKAFTHFVFDTYYETQYGRSYIFMKPMQDESLLFNGAAGPLPSLDSMTLSVTQPNGQLVNNSRDTHLVNKIDNESVLPSPELFPSQLAVQVPPGQYFDKNEFWKGDVVRFRDINVVINNAVPAPDVSDDNVWEFFDRAVSDAGSVAYLVPIEPGLDLLYVDMATIRGRSNFAQAEKDGWLETDSRGRRAVPVYVSGSASGAGEWPSPVTGEAWTQVAGGMAAAEDGVAQRTAVAGVLGEGAWRTRTEQNAEDAKTMNSFLNREEGHKILMTDPGDVAQFLVNKFYIAVPGEFSEDGGFSNASSLLKALDQYNEFVGGQGHFEDPAFTVGSVINMSLQVSVSFRLETEEDDASIPLIR